jgi:hypothetical protein
MDKDLKPMKILAYPPGQYFSVEEQDLVWKYRFFLSQHEKALAKFLQCVHWDKEEEVKQALDLLQQWVTMDTEDALELLGPAYHHPKVRSYAVSRLRQASDEVSSHATHAYSSIDEIVALIQDLLLYLLQLVQALRYERYDLPNAYVVDTAGEEQNRYVKQSTKTNISLLTFFALIISLNGSSENYANVVVPSESVSSDASKSSICEVNFVHSLANLLLTYVIDHDLD